MNMLIYLIPVALLLGALGLFAFLWSVRSGQYEDMDGAAWRALDDGDNRPRSSISNRP
ncbi:MULTISPECIES: cbb3-type cytochrome oxidase assembly protein CcoS [Agrobacterium]|jgi:cbb3-type cytochrome oxidase maturation protein|uniref:Cbb3-type cytochrome oxidase assembly protein CcoS n=1 Tax=Agrobacterium pusense TaxID=648995 RepID=A0A1S9EBQ4_9HYPH|nr:MULTISPECIES: cbb3-type cytochrome oxidase assembly protein CcoS [Agrobacterium]ANV22807.1 cytochrome oxidase maturation protein, cbb3-type [Rhizobium sp. S41]KGE84730.1 cytochrome oxidase maturation protein Cbb3 [Rhizobium sp. H41]MBM7328847.1 cbb3-type cytochrome oxidase assembly protein CcoS [Agrobacterium sp. S2]TGR66916.1 cbb3-type cytochrome oxidase assembly protein CcoS [bacterium M00.F.Ca.ET.194.01.1.1]TGS53463.1 cbb3-type cytochrome oxidase assembly protein CcoS [bacterium M00.F.Ca